MEQSFTPGELIMVHQSCWIYRGSASVDSVELSKGVTLTYLGGGMERSDSTAIMHRFLYMGMIHFTWAPMSQLLFNFTKVGEKSC